MVIAFSLNGEPGTVTVSVESVDDPSAVGNPSHARGFPCCTATVSHQGRGYRTLSGWIQLVRSGDSPSRGEHFDMDPFVLFPDAPSPYAFFGFSPTLFDAPSRDERAPLTWLAHSFLARTPLDGAGRQVVPLAGFSWGFDIDTDGRISRRDARPLTFPDWDAHLPKLRASYPAWSFDPWLPGQHAGSSPS